MTQLTEVGQVAVFRGLKAAPLGDPPHDLPGLIANREREREQFVIEADRPSIDAGQPERPGPAKRYETTKAEVDAGQPSTGHRFRVRRASRS